MRTAKSPILVLMPQASFRSHPQVPRSALQIRVAFPSFASSFPQSMLTSLERHAACLHPTPTLGLCSILHAEIRDGLYISRKKSSVCSYAASLLVASTCTWAAWPSITRQQLFVARVIGKLPILAVVCRCWLQTVFIF